MGPLTEHILKNHTDFIEGKINYLPFNSLGQFTEWFPGIMRGDVTCITGTPASSKTSLSKFLLEHSAIPWAIKQKKNIKILRFGLEESKDQYLYSLLSYRAWKDHGLQYNIKDFLSIGRSIDRQDIPKLEISEKKVDLMMNYIDYIDHIYSSIGIWQYVRKFAFNRGKFYRGTTLLTAELDLKEGWTSYVPNDPEEFIVVVVDNLSFISPVGEEGTGDKGTWMAIWNTVEYLRKFAANKLNYSIVFLQHQDSTSENQESRKNQTILPTENGLGKNKEVGRSYLNLIGVANPNKINSSGAEPVIRIWDNHDLTKFKNYLRTINILKSRFGESNVHHSVLFTGRTGWFNPLPSVTTDDYSKVLTSLNNYK